LVEPGRFVVLEPEELGELAPATDRTMRVERFVPYADLPRAWVTRPYWVGPDGDDEGYFALAEALAQSQSVGVLEWAMRKHRYRGVLTGAGSHLMILTLRPADEVVLASTLHAPETGALDPKQQKLAQQLVETLIGPFEPQEYRDDYREKVQELVAAKRGGKKVKRLKPKKARETDDLAQALRASLAKAKPRKKEERVA
jgi:DNA end-binding protein Ku